MNFLSISMRFLDAEHEMKRDSCITGLRECFSKTPKGSESSREGQGKKPYKSVVLGEVQPQPGLTLQVATQWRAGVNTRHRGFPAHAHSNRLAISHRQQFPRPPNHLLSAKSNTAPKGTPMRPAVAANSGGGQGWVYCPVKESGRTQMASVTLPQCQQWFFLYAALTLLLRLCSQTTWVQTLVSSLIC